MHTLKIATLVVALALLSCAGKSSAQSSQSKQLVIVTTTDFHGTFDRAEGVAKTIRELRREYGDRMIYLDGGDLFQGSLEANMTKGKVVVDFFNQIGLEAAAIGNHELDYGPDAQARINVKPGEDGMGNLKRRVAEAKFKWLSANLIKTDASGKAHQCSSKACAKKNALQQETVFEPHAIITKGNLGVCVIGATTPSTAHITQPSFIKGTRFEPLAPVVLAEATALRKSGKCDFVILVAHAGLSCDGQGRCQREGDHAEILSLLRKLPKRTLDAVVAGHTHLKAQEVIQDTPVIEAGSNARQVGVLKIEKKSDGSIEPDFDSFISIDQDEEDAETTALLKPYREQTDAMKHKPVGLTSSAMNRNYLAETAIGNMVADAIREAGKSAAGAHFGLMNAGGLRADLPSGEITYGDIFKLMPFDNSLAVVELKGFELRRVVEIALSGGHGIAAVSGLKLKRYAVSAGQSGPWKRDLNRDGNFEDWERNLIVELTDDKGRPIEDGRKYKLATLDFLVLGGDHQGFVFDRVLPSRKQVFQGVWIRDVLIDFFQKNPKVRPEKFYSPETQRIFMTPPPNF